MNMFVEKKLSICNWYHFEFVATEELVMRTGAAFTASPPCGRC